MANTDLRREAKNAKVPFWKIAEAIGISETAMSRKMRHELTQPEQKEILAAIARLKEAEG